jgi:hypothetical protein
MWIMVEPVAEIPFGIRWSLTWCYGCNNCVVKMLVQGLHHIQPVFCILLEVRQLTCTKLALEKRVYYQAY